MYRKIKQNKNNEVERKLKEYIKLILQYIKSLLMIMISWI